MESIYLSTSTPTKNINTKRDSALNLAATPDSATRKYHINSSFEPKLSGLSLPPSSPTRCQSNEPEHFSSKEKCLLSLKHELFGAAGPNAQSRERGQYFITPEPSSTLGRGLSEGDDIYEHNDDGETKHPEIPSSPVFQGYSDEEEEDDVEEVELNQHDQELPVAERKNSDSRVMRLDYEFTGSRNDDSEFEEEEEEYFDASSGPSWDPQPSKSSCFASPSRAKVPFTVLSPLAYITTTMVIPRSGEQVTLGRSSKASDFALSSSNRLASRIHVRAEYITADSEQEKQDEENKQRERVKFTCEGWNGCTVVVPSFKRVYKTQPKKQETTNDEKTSDNHQSQKAEFVDVPNGVTDYIIPRGNSVEVDYVEGITIDVRGDIVMVKLGYNHLVKPKEVSTAVNVVETTTLKRKSQDEHKPSKKRVIENVNYTEAKPITKKQPAKSENSTQKAQEEKSSVESATETENDTTFIVSGKEDKQTTSSSSTESSQPQSHSSVDYHRIQHLVSNHLAFSRLHSMPLSSIHNSISALKDVDATDLRHVLGNTVWIGVVTRQGKDAAGRPLEEEYYYIYDKDEDKDRQAMVEKIGARGAGGLRACRKTHKQYYWKMPAKR